MNALSQDARWASEGRIENSARSPRRTPAIPRMASVPRVTAAPFRKALGVTNAVGRRVRLWRRLVDCRSRHRCARTAAADPEGPDNRHQAAEDRPEAGEV